MKLSAEGAALIERFEGFRSTPYKDAVGVWTIGFGSTKGVGPKTASVTRAQADARLRREVDETYGNAVNALAIRLTPSQFDALVSFVYNVGVGGIAPTTGVGRALRRGDLVAAADELLRWDRAGGRQLAGLTARRRAERELFLRPERDALAHLTATERRWAREYDRLVREKRDPDRRRALRSAMTRQRQAVWRAARVSGWSRARRAERYASLRARTT